MQVLCLSDIHGLYQDIALPPCDVVVIAGDATPDGSPEQLADFGQWLRQQPYRRALVVAGNHDRDLARRAVGQLPGIVILQDSGCVVDGIKFWGFPWLQTTTLPPVRHHFGEMTGPDRPTEDQPFHLWPSDFQAKCRLIPKDTDVLISHARIPVSEIPHTPRLRIFGHAPPRRSGERFGDDEGLWIYASVTTRPARGGLQLTHGPVRALFGGDRPHITSVPLADIYAPPEPIPSVAAALPYDKDELDPIELDPTEDVIPVIDIDLRRRPLSDNTLRHRWNEEPRGNRFELRLDRQARGALEALVRQSGASTSYWLSQRVQELVLREFAKLRVPALPPLE